MKFCVKQDRIPRSANWKEVHPTTIGWNEAYKRALPSLNFGDLLKIRLCLSLQTLPTPFKTSFLYRNLEDIAVPRVTMLPKNIVLLLIGASIGVAAPVASNGE